MVSPQTGACLKAFGIVAKKQAGSRNLFTMINVDDHLTYWYRAHYSFFRNDAGCLGLQPPVVKAYATQRLN